MDWQQRWLQCKFINIPHQGPLHLAYLLKQTIPFERDEQRCDFSSRGDWGVSYKDPLIHFESCWITWLGFVVLAFDSAGTDLRTANSFYFIRRAIVFTGGLKKRHWNIESVREKSQAAYPKHWIFWCSECSLWEAFNFFYMPNNPFKTRKQNRNLKNTLGMNNNLNKILQFPLWCLLDHELNV